MNVNKGGRLRKLWWYRAADLRVAEIVTRATDRGDVVITVPSWLAASAQQWVYLRKVERAGEKWAERTAEITPEAWAQAAYRAAEQDGRFSELLAAGRRPGRGRA